MDVRMFDLFSYNGVIIIMPWENKIVFIFVQKCTEYRERVQKDTLKDERKVSSTHTSGASKVCSVQLFQYGSFFSFAESSPNSNGIHFIRTSRYIQQITYFWAQNNWHMVISRNNHSP